MPEGDQGYHSMAYRKFKEMLFKSLVVEAFKFLFVFCKFFIERIRSSFFELRDEGVPIAQSEGAILLLKFLINQVVKELLFLNK